MAEASRQEQTAAESGTSALARPETLPSAQPPTTPEPLQVGAPATSAGGVPAMKHVFGVVSYNDHDDLFFAGQ
ncbi:MAG TPA: hypothetical protein VK458_21925 [Myxococcaceae bacterium]|nr:hypothetical protein [Myxococcaceae bacterium]